MTVIELPGRIPSIDEAAWIAPSATVIGSVRLGPEVGIWYGAVLRADLEVIELGARSNIQDNCVLHADPDFPLRIGENVSVGHNATLHGCTIGDATLVGMGARVLNGAVIGAHSLIAAGTVVPEGAQIPEGSLVAGVPGKVRRELSAEQRAGFLGNASAYVDLIAVHSAATVAER
ncbi:gamma carbonic anhydrase family protein [Flexivirga oryzae]|uniref:Carbonic anhydrase/acetyltransferase-like protein (Isoleucine patch superfamily) n=1 Tax=Flexivirga oryzae TaxID=1794944 RepID=A0A839N940_9MICO|nr:carbonic anhydrase/acetyltransferase-like protein (isoleucine patch superfamily) [Flexivirga oryzae]